MLNRLALTALREAQGLTKSKLAIAAEISGPYLSDLENGHRSGSDAVLAKLAQALGVEVEAITTNEVAS